MFSHLLPGHWRVPVLLFLLCGPASVLADSPVPYSDASIAEGATLFQRYCTECHGDDGRAQVDVISDATNLTEPDEYYSGASPQAIHDSISSGAGVAMPAFAPQLKQPEDVWHLVNFIRSLWTPAQRESF